MSGRNRAFRKVEVFERRRQRFDEAGCFAIKRIEIVDAKRVNSRPIRGRHLLVEVSAPLNFFEFEGSDFRKRRETKNLVEFRGSNILIFDVEDFDIRTIDERVLEEFELRCDRLLVMKRSRRMIKPKFQLFDIRTSLDEREVPFDGSAEA